MYGEFDNGYEELALPRLASKQANQPVGASIHPVAEPPTRPQRLHVGRQCVWVAVTVILTLLLAACLGALIWQLTEANEKPNDVEERILTEKLQQRIQLHQKQIQEQQERIQEQRKRIQEQGNLLWSLTKAHYSNQEDLGSVHFSEKYRNVAAAERGSTCTASSQYSSDYVCGNAIDGSALAGHGHAWATAGQGVGAWIHIDFNQERHISAFEFLDRCHRLEQNQDIELTFSGDNLPLLMTLNDRDGASNYYLDCSSASVQRFQLSSVISTRFVKVTIRTVWSRVNNGFREIRAYERRY